MTNRFIKNYFNTYNISDNSNQNKSSSSSSSSSSKNYDDNNINEIDDNNNNLWKRSQSDTNSKVKEVCTKMSSIGFTSKHVHIRLIKVISQKIKDAT